jgi:hypothetical protein
MILYRPAYKENLAYWVFLTKTAKCQLETVAIFSNSRPEAFSRNQAAKR